MVHLSCHPKNLHILMIRTLLILLILILLLLLFHFPKFIITLKIPTTTRVVFPVSMEIMRESFNSSTNNNGSSFALKKLRKLPHVFDKVLELPLGSDADVAVEDGSEFIRFTADVPVDPDLVNEMRVRAVEIHPGVTKIVVRKGHDLGGSELLLDQLEIDTWRFRLPRSAQPGLASVVLLDGRKIVITVPKSDDRRGFGGGGGDNWRGDSRLVLVQ